MKKISDNSEEIFLSKIYRRESKKNRRRLSRAGLGTQTRVLKSVGFYDRKKTGSKSVKMPKK